MKYNNPVVSIIVPFYNAATTLSDCVNSIVNQSYTDWELLLVDDSSIDGSLDLCNAFTERDSRIKVFSQQHLGVSEARNLGLKNVRGRYICFIDADDIIDSRYIESLLSFKHFDMVICGYFVDFKDSSGHYLRTEQHLPHLLTNQSLDDRDSLLPLFLSGMINCCWNKLFHTSIINNHSLCFRNYPINEDYLFVLDYLSHCQSIKTVSIPLYHWIRIEGLRTGVDSMPSNLLEIYNISQQRTRAFFNDDKLGDVTHYYSYCLIVLKYFKAYKQGLLTNKDLNERLRSFHHNKYVCAAFDAYKPKTKGEYCMHLLLKRGFFHLYYYVYSHFGLLKNLLKFKRNNP